MSDSPNSPAQPWLVQPQRFHSTEPLAMVCQERLDKFTLVYETYGHLSDERDNAILVCHALSGNHHAAGYHTPDDHRPGWWDNLIGPGKPIDTNRWFVVCPNNLGGCHGSTGPVSIDPASGKPYGPDFPKVTVQDWVASQHRLMQHLGLDKWAAVAGGSLGGMQAMQWAIDYPQCIDKTLVIAASARLSAQNIAFNEIARRAIMSDPDFHNGRYTQHGVSPKNGLAVARMLGHVSYLSPASMDIRFGRERNNDKHFSYDPEFSIESYLQHQGNRFVSAFDANTYLLMTRALDYFDPAHNADGDLAQAFSNCHARHLVVSFTADWRFSPRHSEAIVGALVRANKKVSYFEINSEHGHDDFLLENQEYFDAVKGFLCD